MSIRRLQVAAPGGTYPVIVGSGIVGTELSKWVRKRQPSHLYLVTDSRVQRHHGAKVRKILKATGCPVSVTVVPAGESSKSVRPLERLWRQMVQAGCDRNTCVVALGGGVVGDLAGFAAASFLRGVDFVQVPTTLLSMVDASVGGKTGINLPEGKNLVGAFHQPQLVIADLAFLRTLSGRERRAGWAEVIKTAAIRDSRFFTKLERESSSLLAAQIQPLTRAVARCVAIKADVVREDEREGGVRRILNFGHTLAHGIEAVQRYGGLLHGEAVSVGMVFAARLGEAEGKTAPGVSERLEALLVRYGLPVGVKVPSLQRVLAAMDRDKKRGPGGIRWVFLEKLGKTVVVDGVGRDKVRRALGDFLR